MCVCACLMLMKPWPTIGYWVGVWLEKGTCMCQQDNDDFFIFKFEFALNIHKVLFWENTFLICVMKPISKQPISKNKWKNSNFHQNHCFHKSVICVSISPSRGQNSVKVAIIGVDGTFSLLIFDFGFQIYSTMWT